MKHFSYVYVCGVCMYLYVFIPFHFEGLIVTKNGGKILPGKINYFQVISGFCQLPLSRVLKLSNFIFMYHIRRCNFDKWRIYAEAKLAREWRGLSCLFLKIKESTLTWVKNYLIVLIYELNFSFKMALFQKTFPSLENLWLNPWWWYMTKTLFWPRRTGD